MNLPELAMRRMLFLLPLLFLLPTGCHFGKEEPAAEKTVPVKVIKGVRLESVTLLPRPETIEVTGTVKALTSAVVSARLAGVIKQLRVREGSRVRRGDLLAVLDAQENLANAELAKATIDEAQRGTEEAASRKKLAESTFDRYRKLFDEQAVTRQEFDAKNSEKELAVQGLARAEARLKQAREGSRAAGIIAGYTNIIAPISGVITSRRVDLGASVFPGQPLMTIEDDTKYQLELAVPESLSANLSPGSVVQVALDAGKQTFNAKVGEIVPANDPASRSFTVKIALEQKGLKSGMFGRGTISLGTTEKSILLPKAALQERGALTSVWVVGKDKLARMRLVKVGKAIGNQVEILSGISEGELVITAGTAGVSEGASIE